MRGSTDPGHEPGIVAVFVVVATSSYCLWGMRRASMSKREAAWSPAVVVADCADAVAVAVAVRRK